MYLMNKSYAFGWRNLRCVWQSETARNGILQAIQVYLNTPNGLL